MTTAITHFALFFVAFLWLIASVVGSDIEWNVASILSNPNINAKGKQKFVKYVPT